MKFKSKNTNLVTELFVQLEEIMSSLELIDSEWSEVMMTDETQMGDLNLNESDYAFLEDTLGFNNLPKTMLLVDVARKLKSK